MTAKADAQGWLEPQGAMACFPAYSDGDQVIVLDPKDQNTELTRFTFDIVIGANRDDIIAGAQYFRPKGDVLDAIGLQISSAGPIVDDQLAKFKAAGDSESALFLQGLSDRIAEDMAEYVHNQLRERLGLGGTKQGTRWSPGYPAITKIAQNIDIHRLLDAQKRIGARVTEAGEFFPTGCTAAIVSFHPDARYM